MKKDELLQNIVAFYSESRDFNGLPVSDLPKGENVKNLIVQLIKESKIELNRGDRHLNPHIKAFEPEDAEDQIKKIKEKGLEGCLYPTKNHLSKCVKTKSLNNKPFTLMLALGEPQLSFKSFNLNVLEIYRNDPKYRYETDDIHGSIGVSYPYYNSKEMEEKDKIFLKTFGFSYNEKKNRAVAVFLRYLSDLSPEHQKIWHSKMLKNDYKLHPDYYRASIMGNFPERVSIFDAFLEEQKQINRMCKVIGKPSLFKNKGDYCAYKRPRYFGFLIRPTLKEFSDFVHLLDKLISDNINLNFFKSDIITTEVVIKEDGTTLTLSKPTILLLEEWMQRITFPDTEPKDEMLKIFRRIRRMRQRPAHSMDDDKFNQQYFTQQRALIIDAYKAVRTLRLILANHPGLKNFEVPDWLYKGNIWTF